MANHNGQSIGDCHEQAGRDLMPSFYDQIINSVGPDLTIPFESRQYESGQHTRSREEQQESQEQPALFDQSQPRDNFGPIYAVPSFPGQEEITQNMGMGYEVQQGNQENPALFGQGQLRDGLGPIYAIPSFPSPHGDGQHQPIGGFAPILSDPTFPGQAQYGHDMRTGQGFQGSIYPQVILPCCMFYPVVCRYF